MTLNTTTTQLVDEDKNQMLEKWNKCLQEGKAMLLGGTGFGTVASLMTRSFGPLLLMGAVALYTAVDHCDKVFGPKQNKDSSTK